MANLTPKQALARISRIEKAILDSEKRISISILQRRRANMNQRIFVKGIATDGALITSKVIAKGSRIGAYSQRQGSARRSRGRQTTLVDLNDTSNLRSSLIIGESGDKVVLGFRDMKSRRIALSHEQYREKEIFRGTRSERDQDKKVAKAEFRAIIRKASRR